MHSTRGRIRNNLHVQCSVCSLWGTLLLCLWVQVKLKPISIYLFGCTHTDLISLFHSCLLVMTDATYCLVRMGVTIYRWSMNVVVGHPLERLPCFGSQRSGWQIVPYNTDQNWKEKKKEEAKQFKKKCKLWLFFHVL